MKMIMFVVANLDKKSRRRQKGGDRINKESDVICTTVDSKMITKMALYNKF
jgi:hypothetical protein